MVVRTAKNLLVTGGCGFIGSAFIRYLLSLDDSLSIICYDKLTYAANPQALQAVADLPNYHFFQGDILNIEFLEQIITEYKIDTIIHFAAESHVDRSIASAPLFIETNIKGTMQLLELQRRHKHLHFHHISTDEVFGSLPLDEGDFTEDSPYRPRSPYAASKAASDHLVRAWGHTYGLSWTMSHCCNNYGPWQHQEKLIPCMIRRAMKNEPLPIYGNGKNVRDWIHADDHSSAVWSIVTQAKPGSSYVIGARMQLSNLDLIDEICRCLAKKMGRDASELLALKCFVEDRPGHDVRYSIDPTSIKHNLGWKPSIPFDVGLESTIQWYLERS